MRGLLVLILSLILALGLQAKPQDKFVRVEGPNLIQPNGEKLYIQGTNLGNWLNPEGYMFGLSKTNSPWMIDLMIKEAVGPDFAAEFWRQFKDNRERTPSACPSTTGSSPTRTTWAAPRIRTALPASTRW